MKAVLMTAAAVLSVGCVNTYQTARMLPKGKTNVTVGVTNVRSGDSVDGSDGTQDVPEVMIRHGTSDSTELGFRYSAIRGAKNLTLDAKFSLVKDRAALSIPLGLAYGDGDTCCTHIAPTFIWSTPAGSAELTGSFKTVFLLEDGDSETLLGATLGVRLSKDHAKWAFHPEVGVMFSPGEEGHILSLGAAFSVTL